MTRVAGYVIAAVVLAGLGVLSLVLSRVDREMANGQEALVTSDYAGAKAALAAVERYYRYSSRLPWVGDAPLNDLRARQAALAYWQRQYADLAPADRTDPVADVAADNVPLQLIVADAVYRDGQPRAKDRTTTLAVLDAALAAYRTVLNNARRLEDAFHAEDAAHNYEYIVRLRDEVLRGRRRTLPPPAEDTTLGFEGRSERSEFEREFQQYVPLEEDERQKPGAGTFDPPPRKG